MINYNWPPGSGSSAPTGTCMGRTVVYSDLSFFITFFLNIPNVTVSYSNEIEKKSKFESWQMYRFELPVSYTS